MTMAAARPSRTAVKLALGVVTFSTDPGMPRGAGDASAGLLRAAGLLSPLREKAVRSGVYRWIAGSSERLMEGGRGHLVRRKRFFDEEVRRGPLGALVVLGAGLDSLGIRIAGEFPSVPCFEMDTPDTSRAKKAAAVRAGLAPPNLQFIGVDLGAGRLSETLKSLGLKEGTPIVFVAEGLFMYLDERAVASLLRALSAVGGPGSRLLFTWMKRGARGGGLLRMGLRMVGEPIRWVTDPAGVSEVLSGAGWRLERTTDGLECLATAVRSES